MNQSCQRHFQHDYAVEHVDSTGNSEEDIWFKNHPGQKSRHSGLGATTIHLEALWIEAASTKAHQAVKRASRTKPTHPEAILGLALQLYVTWVTGAKKASALRPLLKKSPILEQFMTYECLQGRWKMEVTLNLPKLLAFLQGTLQLLGEEIFASDSPELPQAQHKQGVLQRLSARKPGRTGATLYRTQDGTMLAVKESPQEVADDALDFWRKQYTQSPTTPEGMAHQGAMLELSRDVVSQFVQDWEPQPQAFRNKMVNKNTVAGPNGRPWAYLKALAGTHGPYLCDWLRHLD